MRSLVNYFLGVKEELSKVIWPKPTEVMRLTLIVFIISLGVGAYLGALDLGFVKLIEIAIK